MKLWRSQTGHDISDLETPTLEDMSAIIWLINRRENPTLTLEESDETTTLTDLMAMMETIAADTTADPTAAGA